MREAGNRGLHVNMDVDPKWEGLKAKAPENDLVYVKEYLPGYRGGLVANGVHRYAPAVVKGDLERGAEVYENLTSGAGSAIRARESGRPGVLVIPLISPYVYLGGKLKLVASGRSSLDVLKVSISTNNGRTFVPVFSETQGKRRTATVDLKDKIFRRYAYWLRVELEGGTALESLEVENDFQHAPRTVPWLDKGKNTITVAADRDTAIATRSIACRITADPAFNKNETSTTMGVVFDNVDVRGDACWWKGGTGTMTVPVEVPGDLVSLRFSTQFRARSPKDRIRVTASADNGRAWREVAVLQGPTQGRTEHVRAEKWPVKTRKVLLRFEMTGNNTAGVQSFRIDADYHDPMAARALRPFRVVHRWKEGAREKMHAETIARLPAKYTIQAASEPEMVSVGYEMEGSR